MMASAPRSSRDYRPSSTPTAASAMSPEMPRFTFTLVRQAFAYAKGATCAFLMWMDVRRDGDAAVCHALTDVLGVAALSLGHLAHAAG